jgi:hypothetical protein
MHYFLYFLHFSSHSTRNIQKIACFPLFSSFFIAFNKKHSKNCIISFIFFSLHRNNAIFWMFLVEFCVHARARQCTPEHANSHQSTPVHVRAHQCTPEHVNARQSTSMHARARQFTPEHASAR